MLLTENTGKAWYGMARHGMTVSYFNGCRLEFQAALLLYIYYSQNCKLNISNRISDIFSLFPEVLAHMGSIDSNIDWKSTNYCKSKYRIHY